MEKKVFIKTFGCQMNEYDSNRIYDSVKNIGYTKSEDQNNVDCYILNTCHIRDKAKEKVYHEIGRVKKNYKGKEKPIVVVAGCVAQAENEEMLKREPYIDIVIGPQSYHKINDLIKNQNKNKKIDETEFDTVTKFKYFDEIKNKDNKISAFLTIQEGCDKFCHFCVVPYTRGPEYSRPFDQIINEAETLIKNGAREITLLGQNVNAYSFLYNGKEFRISDLINKLEKYSELERIRYTTSHPRDMTDDLIDCYSTSKKLMPFVHLPIQSGSDRILNLMNRKHKVEDYLNIYERLMKINDEIKFSSDFIIGYPGETEEDFEVLKNWVKETRFERLGCFTYSHEENTHAYQLEDDVPEEIKEQRAAEIMEIQGQISWELNQRYVGGVYRCLVDRVEDGFFVARTEFDSPEVDNEVLVDAKKHYLRVGDFVDLEIVEAADFDLYAEPVDSSI